jgi:hypothetical protein
MSLEKEKLLRLAGKIVLKILIEGIRLNVDKKS